MSLTEIKKGIWKEKGANYTAPKTFQIKCSSCGSTKVDMTVTDFGAKIHICCNKCGESERF